MVQPAFEIGTAVASELPADARALVEVSGQSVNYIVYTKDPYKLLLLRQYRMYTTADRSTADLLDEIISGDEILQFAASRATIIYNFPCADLVPSEHYSPHIKSSITRLLTGNTSGQMTFDENVRGWNIQVVYSVSAEIHALCRQKFAGGQYWHLYTLVLLWSALAGQHKGNLCRAVFYNDKFVVAFFRNSQLQLLQTFVYQTPEDVAYAILLICRQFGVSQQEILLNISGLIDTQSALYTELLKYFAEVHFEGVPENYTTDGLLDELPGHYFSPLLKMSICV